MRIRPLCLALLIAAPLAQADEQVRATQEELRRRNVYFGDIDGRSTPELSEALKRFQQRKGYIASGRMDPPTLRLLGLSSGDSREPAPREQQLPEEPVLKSDIQINPLAEARAVSQETGIAVAELAGVAEQRPGHGRNRHPATPNATSATTFANIGRSGGQAPRSVPQSGGGGVMHGVNQVAQALDPAQLAPLVRGYLKAVASDDIRDELQFLADRVDYLGHGLMDRRVIEHTLRSYNSRWPSRSYKQVGPLQYNNYAQRGVYMVSFQADFTLKRGRVKAEGRVQYRLIFDAATVDPRIIGIQEERVRVR